jgi:hypothetical protein
MTRSTHIHWCGVKVRVFRSTNLTIGNNCCSTGLARWLPIYLLQQALLRQTLPGYRDGGARTAACLQLVLVTVVVSRWSKDLLFFEFFVLLWILSIDLCFCKKKRRFYCYWIHLDPTNDTQLSRWSGTRQAQEDDLNETTRIILCSPRNIYRESRKGKRISYIRDRDSQIEPDTEWVHVPIQRRP